MKIVRDRFLDDTETAARFAREARTVARLQHPNIVAVHGARRLRNGGLALVMQHIPGRTLKQVIRDQGPLPFALVEQVLGDVAAALTHAHHHRVIHRDIKPENIYLHEESGRALLADFGIAKPIDGENSLTLNGTVIGTPAYMSPEQVDGRAVDGRGDLYSLGLVGYEMLTGKRPWEGENLYSIIYKQKHEELPPLLEQRPDMPAALQTALAGALRKDREQRWSGVAEFAARLAPATAAGVPANMPALEHLFAASATVPAEDESAHTIRYRKRAPEAPPPPAPAAVPAGASEPVSIAALAEEVEAKIHAGPARRVRGARRRMPPARRVVGAAVVLILGAGATLLARTGLETRTPGAVMFDPALMQGDDRVAAPEPTPPTTTATDAPEPSEAGETSRPESVPAPVPPAPAPVARPAPPAPRREAPRTPTARRGEGTVAAPRLADPRVEMRPAPQPALAAEREPGPSLTPVAVGPRLRNRGAVEAALAAALPRTGGAEGTGVSLGVLVGADGRVHGTRVNGSSGNDAVDAAAQRAARRMEFDPAAGQTELLWVNVALRLPGS